MNVSIEIPQELAAKLFAMAAEMQSQENRRTTKPYYYTIREPKVIYGIEEDNDCDGYVIVDPEGVGKWNPETDSYEELRDWMLSYQETFDDPVKFCELINETPDFELEGLILSPDADPVFHDFRTVGIRKTHEESNCFLTEKAALAFIEQNKHKLPAETDTYLIAAYRNPEMDVLWQLFEAIAQQAPRQSTMNKNEAA